MIIHRGRIVFWFLLVLFGLGVLVWLFYIPYKPQRLFSMIPDNAAFVSRHYELADRWDDFRRNPFAMSLFKTAGLDPSDLTDWSDDPDVRVWVDKLLERDVVIAFVPEHGVYREPAWIIAGWIGGESPRLRMLFTRGKIRELTKVRRHPGGSYWRVDTGDEKNRLSIAVVDGMIMGCFSVDPDAVRYALDVYDGRLPSIEPLLRDAPFRASADDVTASDQGWYRGASSDPADALYMEFTRIDGTALAGAVEFPGARRMAPHEPMSPASLGRVLGPLPFALSVVQGDAFLDVWQDLAPPSWNRALAPVFDLEGAGPVSVGLLGGEYGGQLKGISIPALFVGVQVPDGRKALDAAAGVLDRINAEYRWGLVASESISGERPVYVIESTANTAYSGFRFRERIAYTVLDDWFLLGSNSRTVMQLASRYDRPEAVQGASRAGWLEAVRQTDAAGYGWIDLREGARTVRLAITAYMLKLLFEDPRGSEEERRKLNDARAWIDALEPMEQAHFWLSAERERARLRFHVGK